MQPANNRRCNDIAWDKWPTVASAGADKGVTTNNSDTWKSLLLHAEHFQHDGKLLCD